MEEEDRVPLAGDDDVELEIASRLRVADDEPLACDRHRYPVLSVVTQDVRRLHPDKTDLLIPPDLAPPARVGSRRQGTRQVRCGIADARSPAPPRIRRR